MGVHFLQMVSIYLEQLSTKQNFLCRFTRSYVIRFHLTLDCRMEKGSIHGSDFICLPFIYNSSPRWGLSVPRCNNSLLKIRKHFIAHHTYLTTKLPLNYLEVDSKIWTVILCNICERYTTTRAMSVSEHLEFWPMEPENIKL